MRMESANLRIADEANASEHAPRGSIDVRQRNAILLFPPNVKLPDGWQAPWIQAGWAVANCSSSERIPAALHGPGASALIASPWAEVGKPALSGTVARGLKAITAQAAEVKDSQWPVSSPGGMLRRSDFLARLSQVISAPEQGCTVLMSIQVDQAASLAANLKRTGIFELEETLSQRLASVLEKSDAITIWLEFGFGVLVQRERSDEVVALTSRICSSIASKPFLVDGESCSLTVSVGLALAPREATGDGAQHWFGSAHAAQGIASRHGGNRSAGVLGREYEPMLPERVLIIREWVQEARSGNNVVIEYQPLMPMNAGAAELYSVHAKLRDHRAPLGGVHRQEYLRIAREAEAMVMIDRMSLFHAFETLQQESDRGRNTQLLVPIELETLRDLPWRWFEAELRRRRHLAGRLIVEIEASPTLMDKDSIKRIVRLRHHGVRIGLSDGSRNLDQVWLWAKLPVDVLRLQYSVVLAFSDANFRRAIEPWTSKGRLQIVDSVEDTAALSRLASLGIDHLRGAALAEIGPRLDYDFSSIG